MLCRFWFQVILQCLSKRRSQVCLLPWLWSASLTHVLTASIAGWTFAWLKNCCSHRHLRTQEAAANSHHRFLIKVHTQLPAFLHCWFSFCTLRPLSIWANRVIVFRLHYSLLLLPLCISTSPSEHNCTVRVALSHSLLPILVLLENVSAVAPNTWFR